MKNFYTEEQWNEILKQQESVLRYDTFTRKQALELGLCCRGHGEKYHGSSLSASWRTRRPVFAYKMGGRDAGSRLVEWPISWQHRGSRG